jgi:hypothetical protein
MVQVNHLCHGESNPKLSLPRNGSVNGALCATKRSQISFYRHRRPAAATTKYYHNIRNALLERLETEASKK